jgi:hypothetical protein
VDTPAREHEKKHRSRAFCQVKKRGGGKDRTAPLAESVHQLLRTETWRSIIYRLTTLNVSTLSRFLDLSLFRHLSLSLDQSLSRPLALSSSRPLALSLFWSLVLSHSLSPGLSPPRSLFSSSLMPALALGLFLTRSLARLLSLLPAAAGVKGPSLGPW